MDAVLDFVWNAITGFIIMTIFTIIIAFVLIWLFPSDTALIIYEFPVQHKKKSTFTRLKESIKKHI